MATAYNPKAVWTPFGAFSQAVVAGEGRLVFLKGQVALDADGAVVGEGDMVRQVEQVLDNIQNVLGSFGGRMADIVSLTQHTTDIAAFMECGSIRQRYFNEPYPVTTTIEVSALYDTRLKIEITAIAEIPVDRFDGSLDGRHMHG
ncbi:RidA family protein [Amylibacter sp. SFDW26]|uniref:RidA family protein n=1 Tax=Amylibacter sp. SFDW26 TaxID=2652722 RepID=UPI001261D926|nr:RidA family protein [Amylibacter sp. SFDW26]KAB7615664.1 RidA family protein [Amylibacter sp. SFDW26]